MFKIYRESDTWMIIYEHTLRNFAFHILASLPFQLLDPTNLITISSLDFLFFLLLSFMISLWEVFCFHLQTSHNTAYRSCYLLFILPVLFIEIFVFWYIGFIDSPVMILMCLIIFDRLAYFINAKKRRDEERQYEDALKEFKSLK